MTHDEHIERHKKLHAALDELLADYIDHTGAYPSKISLMKLMDWSFQQCKCPTQSHTHTWLNGNQPNK